MVLDHASIGEVAIFYSLTILSVILVHLFLTSLNTLLHDVLT